MVEDSRTSADDPSCCGACGAQSWLFCAGGYRPVVVAAKRLGAAPCSGGGDDGFFRSALRAAADARQLGAALYAGVLSSADRVGQFSFFFKNDDSSDNTLVFVARCLAVCVDLIWLLIHLLVVLDIGVDGGT